MIAQVAASLSERGLGLARSGQVQIHDNARVIGL